MDVKGTRIVRIARGAGVWVRDVECLIDEHKRMKQLVEKIQKTNMGKGNEAVNFKRNEY